MNLAVAAIHIRAWQGRALEVVGRGWVAGGRAYQLDSEVLDDVRLLLPERQREGALAQPEHLHRFAGQDDLAANDGLGLLAGLDVPLPVEGVPFF